MIEQPLRESSRNSKIIVQTSNDMDVPEPAQSLDEIYDISMYPYLNCF